MREIKFRVWNELRGQWYFIGEELHSLAPEIQEMNKRDEWKCSVLEQFTGLKDIHGEDIYEGDIVRRINSEGTIELCEVKYKAPYWTVKDYDPQYGYTVVGNIHQNPELLK